MNLCSLAIPTTEKRFFGNDLSVSIDINGDVLTFDQKAQLLARDSSIKTIESITRLH